MAFYKKIIQILFFCITTITLAQYEITIEAEILDNQTKQPIPYAIINFNEKSIQTIANKEGRFILSFYEESIKKSDLIKFSAFGYSSIEVSIEQLYRLLKNTAKIYLKPIFFQKDLKENSYSYGNLIGKVSTNKIPIQGASVKIKNKLKSVLTDIDGNFSINVDNEDVLIISFLGM
ncbi:MAG: carboxypeptidase-like regulatory domain-containing protein, partial [Chitinophagales bacterium]